jgi:hypothetical protein
VIAQGTLLVADFLYTLHAWVFGLVFFVLLLIAGEAGFQIGRRTSARFYEDTKKRVNAVEAAILGVLGLLLAFTLVMAVARFDIRRQLVIDETNAIATSYWRSQLVPPPEGPELPNLLREYVDTKVHYFDIGIHPDRLQVSRDRTARLQAELWSRASAFAQKDPRSIPAGLLLQSLNQTFDLENSRWNALMLHVPDGVLWVDIIVALLAAIKVGYAFGVGGRRHPFSLGLLAMCIATVLAITLDLDQPQQGLIRVNDQPLIDLQHELTKGH